MTQTAPTPIGPSTLLVKEGKWDFKNPLPPALTTEFYQSYIINIKGKQYVKVDGLITVAHAKGFKAIIPELIEAPNANNGNTAIFKVTIKGWGWDPVLEQVVEVEVVGHGDANPQNCNAMVSAHFIRIAETRAIGRALRTYTNVNICTLEELDAVIQIDMIASEQVAEIGRIMKMNNISKERAQQISLQHVGKVDVMSLTKDEAGIVIMALKTAAMDVSPVGVSQQNPQAAQPSNSGGPNINPDLDTIPGA